MKLQHPVDVKPLRHKAAATVAAVQAALAAVAATGDESNTEPKVKRLRRQSRRMSIDDDATVVASNSANGEQQLQEEKSVAVKIEVLSLPTDAVTTHTLHGRLLERLLLLPLALASLSFGCSCFNCRHFVSFSLPPPI